ncbi:MAG: hypothetical protein ACLT98_11195, partial [Eggerthellaceae bacterium]
ERASRRSDESTSPGSRPHQYNTRQTARSTAARSRPNATQQPRNAASPYQKPGRYHRPPSPEQPRRRAVGIIASLLVVAAFAVGGYFVVQSLPASITLNGANLEVGGHKTLEDAARQRHQPAGVSLPWTARSKQERAAVSRHRQRRSRYRWIRS